MEQVNQLVVDFKLKLYTLIATKSSWEKFMCFPTIYTEHLLLSYFLRNLT